MRNIGEIQPVDPEPLPVSEMQRIMAGIEDLRLDIQARIEAIEDGSFEDFDDYDYYDDEDPDLVSEEQLSSLAGFFAEADSAFARNDKPTAKKMYEALFELVDEVDETGILPEHNIDLRRERARYARCVYETTAQEERPRALVSVMGLEDEGGRNSWYRIHNLPLLREVVASDRAALPEWDGFLTAWRSELLSKDFRLKRVAGLLLEATALLSGVAAVAELAGTWGAQQPLGYLFLLEQLANDGDWPGLTGAAREALATLPEGAQRARAAAFLVTAGQKLGQNEAILTGYRERLRSLPTDTALGALVAEAARQHRRTEQLDEIHVILAARNKEHGADALQVKALLMAGKIDEAFAVCPTETLVGWSSGSAGLIFAAVLYLLSGGNPECMLIGELLRDHAERPSMMHPELDRETRADVTNLVAIKAGLDAIDRCSFAADRYRRWAGDLGERRVVRILKNQHRNAYGRAALVLGGLAETLATGGEIEKAQKLLREYCRVLFTRHTAFHREIKAAIGRSKILAGRISLL